MSRRRRRRHQPRRPINFRIYAIITLACVLLALLVHLAFDVTGKAKEYADEKANAMVKDVMKDAMKDAIKGR